MEPTHAQLAGKTALVTGGAHRIGRATVLALAKQAVNVVIHYNRSHDAADDVAEQAGRLGVQAWTCQADLSESVQAQALLEQALGCADQIDFLVNSASIFTDSTLNDVSVDDIMQNIRVNALAPFVISRGFSSQKHSGAIVNFLDTRVTDYDSSHYGYHISKRMFYTMTRTMSLEFAPLVRVNGVAPGLILPPPGRGPQYLEALKATNPLQRVGDVRDITESVLFLLESEFVTGQVIYVDGGRHLKGSVYASG